MKERPILFSTPMVRAILAGAKTQTRRVLAASTGLAEVRGTTLDLRLDHHRAVAVGLCRHGQPGDRLWVRETWATRDDVAPASAKAKHYLLYRADGGDLENEWHYYDRWRPSIHMPRWASRLTLSVTEVRVQRLQEITAEDALAEGVDSRCTEPPDEDPRQVGYPAHYSPDGYALDNFRALWDSINGKRPGCSWDANPWVWAVSFKRINPEPTP